MGEDETVGKITMLQTPPTFGKRLERSLDINEGEPLELKAKIDGSPKPTVSLKLFRNQAKKHFPCR